MWFLQQYWITLVKGKTLGTVHYSCTFTCVTRPEELPDCSFGSSGFFLSPAATAEGHNTQVLSVLLHLCSSYSVLLSGGLLLCHLSHSGPAGSSLCATMQPCLLCPQPLAKVKPWNSCGTFIYLLSAKKSAVHSSQTSGLVGCLT